MTTVLLVHHATFLLVLLSHLIYTPTLALSVGRRPAIDLHVAPHQHRPPPLVPPATASATVFRTRAQVDELTRHPAAWDPSSSSSPARKKLRPRHLPLFGTSTLFDRFASTICETGVMARKEVFETWAAALHIDAHFGMDCRRVADVAAGHGLLAWALLLLDDDRRRQQSDSAGSSSNGKDHSSSSSSSSSSNYYQPRTALCVDRRMPPAAVTIERAMKSAFPQLTSEGRSRFSYVEGSLEQLRPHPSCLLTSVHACAGLSDLLVKIAAEDEVPVALVPCCHSRKKLVGYSSDFAREEYDAIVNAPERVLPDLTDRLDGARVAALTNAGFEVGIELLPGVFTAKNRLIMASPQPPPLGEGGRIRPPPLAASSSRASPTVAAPPPRPGRMAPPPHVPPPSTAATTTTTTTTTTTAKDRFLAKMTIPCEDAPRSRAHISTLSGKVAAERRRLALHVRNHADCPELDVSIWLPADGGGSSSGGGDDFDHGADEDEGLAEASLSVLGSAIDSGVQCSAAQLGPVFVNSAGRRAKAFRLRYTTTNGSEFGDSGGDDGESRGIVSKQRAKAIHEEVYRRIPVEFPGAECR